MKRRLLPNDFELAWRLRPESWNNWRSRGALDTGKRYQYAKRVLVEGAAIERVCDKDFLSDGEYVGKSRLSDIVQQTYDQFFGTFG